MTLLSRLAQAKGPDRELDGLVWFAVKPPLPGDVWQDFDGVRYLRDADDEVAFEAPPPFTSSIDAVLRLLPEGWEWVLTMAEDGAGAFVENEKGEQPRAYAETPAIALLIAILKARGIE